MTRRLIAFVVLAVAFAAIFVRLAFWQLDRRAERRAINAELGAQLAAPTVPFARLDAPARLRRVWVEGTPDFENEFVHAGRSRDGSPGVHVLTPVRRAGTDTAVLVNRGWIYAPDAMTADLPRWREPSRRVFSGYVQLLDSSAAAPPRSGARRLRILNRGGVGALVPYPVDTRYIVATDSASDQTPARLAEPRLDDGPHLSYAVQWFAFAAIALIGATAVVLRARGSAGATGA